MKELCIIQPYVPSYRVPFFTSLRARLGQAGIELRVVAGQPTGAQAARGDAATRDWIETAHLRQLRLARRELNLSVTRRYWGSAAGIIFPHLGSSIDVNLGLMAHASRKVGLWGHIRSYTAPANPLDQLVEKWQLRVADHVFAYVPSGAKYAQSCGVPADRITVVMNTVDTGQLRADIDDLSAAEVGQFREAAGLPTDNLLAFVGGLDGSKRIGFLAEALDILHADGRRVHIGVAGRGADEALLATAVERGQVTLLGHLEGRDKAALLTSAAAIVNPGRVGLLAVDALVARRRIITTRWPWHAPEVEYLAEPESVSYTADDPAAFARAMADAATASGEGSPAKPAAIPTLDGMVDNFARGVCAMLAS